MINKFTLKMDTDDQKMSLLLLSLHNMMFFFVSNKSTKAFNVYSKLTHWAVPIQNYKLPINITSVCLFYLVYCSIKILSYGVFCFYILLLTLQLVMWLSSLKRQHYHLQNLSIISENFDILTSDPSALPGYSVAGVLKWNLNILPN